MFTASSMFIKDTQYNQTVCKCFKLVYKNKSRKIFLLLFLFFCPLISLAVKIFKVEPFILIFISQRSYPCFVCNLLKSFFKCSFNVCFRIPQWIRV